MGLKGIGMIVDQEIILIGAGIAFRQDVDQCPAGMGEMNGSGRQLGNGVREVHLLGEDLGIGAADGVGQVKE